MPIHPSTTRRVFAIAAILFVLQAVSFAQQIPPEVAQYGYADTVFINGKVISMDDKSTSTEVGNIYQGPGR